MEKYTFITHSFFGAFAKSLKATVSVVTSVRPCGNDSAPTGRIFHEILFFSFIGKSAEIIQIPLKFEKTSRYYVKTNVHL